MSSTTESGAFPGRAAITQVGRLFALAFDVIVAMFRRPFQWRDFIEQSWFVAKVSSLPTALFSIPFGATIALLLYQLLKQFGSQYGGVEEETRQ